MQLIANGPDIPDALLQAHEEGRVVFFCGAGISYPAGLPGFKGLVEEIYRINGTTLTNIERDGFDREQYDVTLDLLERRLPGQRLAVRRALKQALRPKLRRKDATDTHAALLQLARNREGALRLVTTNFDRLFHVAAKRTGQEFLAHAAPMLPIPKNSRWNGMVHLHGLLPGAAKVDDTALNRLVVTSGDFGLAYLTERWAARFVSELFRNYVVCFVGYSINDPVLRYMMDALAADRMLGEVSPQAWALGDCRPGQEAQKTIEWEAKGVIPILYHVEAGTHDHSALHQTLRAWAEIYRDGVTGKERIIVEHALARPSSSTRQDDFVGRVLWALSDPSGLPAKRFAEINPVPSLDWLLNAFSIDRYGHSDLIRFGVPTRDNTEPQLQFSLISRPAPYMLAPRMQLITTGPSYSKWDNVMSRLAHWLTRHLNDPRLVLWIAEHGGQLHEHWIWEIEYQLDRLIQLESNGKTSDLDDIRAYAPNAIPSPLMRMLWRLLLSGRVKSPWHERDLYQWKRRLKRDGLTATVRLEFREILSPKVRFSKPFYLYDEPKRLRQLVDWELVLSVDHASSALRDLSGNWWQAALPVLLEDIQLLLRDALDLLRELGEADDRSDRSFLDLPSISPHRQNRGFRDWVSLIELARDAWLATRNLNAVHASQIATQWFKLPYATFKRLALFAASQENAIPSEEWVGWLLDDEAWWLWAADTKREVLRLLVLQGHRLTSTSQERLEAAILAGPLRALYQGVLDPKEWRDISERSIWLRLAKLDSAGLTLGAESKAKLTELSILHSEWKLAKNERDEFSLWMSGTGDPDFEESRIVNIAPRKRRELAQWLEKPLPAERLFYEDTWRDVCRTRFFQSLYALCDLAQKDVWPTERWQQALQVWSEDGIVLRSWRFAAPLVRTMPNAVLKQVAHGVTTWLKAASKSITRHESILLDICQRVLDLPLNEEVGNKGEDGKPIEQPVTEAINHPIGHVTQALINLWFGRRPNDGDRLPTDIRSQFTQLCNTEVRRFRHGRVLLASQLIALFRVDRAWTEHYLLPLFDWKAARMEAMAVWQGFLWSPRLHQPLLIALKSQFLDSANHYTDLGEHRQQFAAFLTYAALDRIDGYTTDEFRDAIGVLPLEGLEEAAQAFSQAVEGAADRSGDYWKNRGQPFWLTVWPKSREIATPRIAESLARLVIAARSEFPAALYALCDWLMPIEKPGYIIHLLIESSLCEKFPLESLILLNSVIVDQSRAPKDLHSCLDQILQAKPSLEQDARYRRLRDYCRRCGI